MKEANIEKLNVNEKPYTFRKLSAEDIFPMFTIINKIGFKEFKGIFEGDNLKGSIEMFKAKQGDKKSVENAIEELGITVLLDAVQIIIANLPKCEDDIFKMLASTSDLSEKEVRKLGMADFAEMIIDFVKKEEFGDFFKVVSKLFN